MHSFQRNGWLGAAWGARGEQTHTHTRRRQQSSPPPLSCIDRALPFV